MPILRLQKYMSECGICSRRHAEEAIARGDVIVNGSVAQIGQSVDPDVDVIKFGGKLITRSESLVYYAMNKPRGIETTCAQKDGKSIIDIIDTPTRIFPIGRLDKDSSGLILLTNDGRLTHRLLHPSFEHEKEYLVTTYGKIDDHSLDALRTGVRYSISEGPKTQNSSRFIRPGGQGSSPRKGTPNSKLQTPNFSQKFVQTLPCEVKRVSSDTFTIVLTEGKNRQIRRMVEACGHEVKKLKRIRIEHIQLGDMPDGAYRDLKRGEREELLRRACLPLVDFNPIVGVVIHGDGRGHQIGFPTANLTMPIGTLPDASFSCRVKIGEDVYLGAGTFNPKKSAQAPFLKGPFSVVDESENEKLRRMKDGNTGIKMGDFDSGNPQPASSKSSESDSFQPTADKLFAKELTGTFEVHIIGFDRDIYGETIHVDIMDIIRDNRTFLGIDDLCKQIEKDIHHVRAHWSRVLQK